MFGTMDRSVSGMTVSEVDETESTNKEKVEKGVVTQEKVEDEKTETTRETEEADLVASSPPLPAILPPQLDLGHTILDEEAETPMNERPLPLLVVPTRSRREHASERSYDSDSTISAMPRASPIEEGILPSSSTKAEEDEEMPPQAFVSRLPRRSHPAPTWVSDMP